MERESLQDKKHISGLYGARGYEFEKAFILSQFPDWLASDDLDFFQQELWSDLELFFKSEYRWLIQIKNHSLELAEFRSVIMDFQTRNINSGGQYEKYVIVSTGATNSVREIWNMLERWRDIQYLGDPELSSTRAHVISKFDAHNLADIKDFLLNNAAKIQIESEAGWVKNESLIREIFISKLKTKYGIDHQDAGSMYLRISQQLAVERGKRIELLSLRNELNRASRSASQSSYSPPNLEAVEVQDKNRLLGEYRKHLIERERISKVRILGNTREYDLTKVFVELIIRKERRQSFTITQSEYWGLMDSELRELRSRFLEEFNDADEDQIGETGAPDSVKPDDLLHFNTPAIVVGAPGSGKSVLLRYLTSKTIEQDDHLTIFLELKRISEIDLDKAGRKLEALIFEKALVEPLRLDDRDRSRLKQIFVEQLKSGKTKIFLDGLDEVSGPELLLKLRYSLRDFIQSPYRHNTLIISTRPYALDEHFSRDEILEMEIAPFNERQIKQFISHYYDNQQAQRFMKNLRGRRELRGLINMPALLGLILRFEQGEEIKSNSRLETYRLLVHQLNSEWDESKGTRRGFHVRSAVRRLDFLKYLAFTSLFGKNDLELYRRLTFTSQTLLREAEAYCRVKNLTAKPEDLAEDAQLSPLLREIGTDMYAFTHLTIQEYLAAVSLSENEMCKEIFCKYYFDPLIIEMEVLPMTLGLVPNASHLYDLLNDLPESLTCANIRLRARGLAYTLNIGTEQLSMIAHRLIEFITEQRPEESAYFHDILSSFSSIRVQHSTILKSHITPLLTSEETTVLGNTVAALEEIGCGEIVDELLVLLEASDEDLVHRSISSLGAAKDERALNKLIEILRSGSPKHLSSAIRALGQIGGERAELELLTFLKRTNTFAHFGVVEALAEIGGERVVKGLIELLGHSKRYVRENALEALTKINDAQAEDFLCRALKDKSYNVRDFAVEALGEIGSKHFLPELINMLKDCNHWVRARTLRAIVSIDRAGAEEYLIQALGDNNPRVTETAANELKNLGSDQAVIALIKALSHKHPRTRASAAGALGKSGDERAVTPLLKTLRDKDAYPRGWAVEALVRIGKNRFIKQVLMAMDDRDNFVRYMAANALGMIGGEIATDRLLWELSNDVGGQGLPTDDEVLAAVAEALGRIGEEKAIGALLAVLHDRDTELLPIYDKDHHEIEGEYWAQNECRKMAAKALGEIGGSRAINGLCRFINDEDEEVRYYVVRSLGIIGGKDVIEALLTSLKDDSEEIRRIASSGLVRINGMLLASGLIKAFSHNESFVRLKAVQYIGYYVESNEAHEALLKLAKHDPAVDVMNAARKALESLEYKLHYFC